MNDLESAARHPVLIVEDDFNVRTALADLLRDEGYDVVARANGQEAYDYLQDHPRPCIILLDLWMPIMNGDEFRRRQLADPALSDIPVVLISAARDVHLHAVTLQARAYLKKPIDLDSLLDLVLRNC